MTDAPKEIIGDISSMIFGLAAFHACRFLLWLAPRTVVIANAHIALKEGTAVTVPSRGRLILVRCYAEYPTETTSNE
jgi:hypothetical protein